MQVPGPDSKQEQRHFHETTKKTSNPPDIRIILLLTHNMRLPIEKIFLIRLCIDPGRTGEGHCTAQRRKLTGIKAPCVLHMPIPLLRQEHEPLLPGSLVELGVGVPRPQQGTCGQYLLCARAACIRQAIRNSLHPARRPNLDSLAVLTLVRPAYLEPLADEVDVESRCLLVLPRLDAVGDSCRFSPKPRRLCTLQQPVDAKHARRLDAESVCVCRTECLSETWRHLRRRGGGWQLPLRTQRHLVR
mmetsp:Transcript_32312/g.72887  ORF Transcript_32312/g.72887 Transcript_32312/m.72887 type:complete len:245 (-) Transcript_32312:3546-4280(-)